MIMHNCIVLLDIFNLLRYILNVYLLLTKNLQLTRLASNVSFVFSAVKYFVSFIATLKEAYKRKVCSMECCCSILEMTVEAHGEATS